ncbi:hypothetical protein GXW82_44005 [Streptacidiphilus sp. 4-A2]|nr:hypothetical protein [Streptacidiphilus sp. 4-A2]
MAMAMADSGALMGLIGAIGGALIGGAAGVYGPLLLRRREARELEAERAAERLASAVERAQEEASARIVSLSAARVTTRLWFDFLVQTVNRASAGEQIDILAFHAEQRRLAEEATGFCYDIARLRMADRWHGDPNDILRSLRNASDVIYHALMTGERTGAWAPSVTEIAVVLDEVATARSWFRLAVERLVQEYPQTSPAFHPLPPSNP